MINYLLKFVKDIFLYFWGKLSKETQKAIIDAILEYFKDAVAKYYDESKKNKQK